MPGHPRMAWVRDWPRTEGRARPILVFLTNPLLPPPSSSGPTTLSLPTRSPPRLVPQRGRPYSASVTPWCPLGTRAKPASPAGRQRGDGPRARDTPHSQSLSTLFYSLLISRPQRRDLAKRWYLVCLRCRTTSTDRYLSAPPSPGALPSPRVLTGAGRSALPTPFLLWQDPS